MPTFAYTVRDQQGSLQTGSLDAIDQEEVVAILQRRGLLVTTISRKDLQPRRAATTARRFRSGRMHTGVKTEDQVLLCQQLATLVEAGVPLLKSLEVASAQVESARLLMALDEARRDVEAGRTLRDALAKHPAVFSNLWVNLIETGETSGHLAQSLRQLARHFEAAERLQSAAKTAMTYPAFLLVASILVMAVFVYWVIPKFTGVFASMHIPLPLLTRIVIGVSDVARQYVAVVLFSGVGAGYALRRVLLTEQGQWVRDRLLLRLPLFGTLLMYVQLAEFGRGLSTLLESGVPLLSGLGILEHSATNKVYGQAIGTIREAVKEGQTMAEPMTEAGVFPPLTIQLVHVGEEVGQLTKMAGHIAHYYEERVDTFISRMTRLFEPIAIVCMGIFVMLIVLAIFMPIFNMAGGFKT